MAMAALALGLLVAPPVWAAVGDAVPSKAEPSVTVPFSPTLGKPIHLHSEKRVVVVRDGVETPREVSTSDDELIYTERNEDGFVLRWTNKAATVHTDPDRQALMEKIVSASVGKTEVIQTNARGVPTTVVNVAEMRTLLATALDTMVSAFDTELASKPQAERDTLRKVLASLAQTYRGMTDDQLGALVLKDPKMLFGFGGVALTRGQPLSFKTNVTLPMINTPLAATETVALQDAGAAEVTIAVSSTSDPADVKAAIAAFADKTLAAAGPSQRESLKAKMDKLQDFAATDDLVLTLDARTGMIRHATHTKHVSVNGQSQVTTETYAVVE